MYAVSNWTSVIASSTTINREAKTNKHKKNYLEKKKKRTTSAVGTSAIRNECERRCLSVAFLRRLPSLTGNARKMMRWICSLGGYLCFVARLHLFLLRTTMHASCCTAKIFQITGQSCSDSLCFVYLVVKLICPLVFYGLLLL